MQASSEYTQLMNAINFTNACLEWNGQPHPKPCLWENAGHPSLPISLKLHALDTKLKQILSLMRWEILCYIAA